MIDLKAIKDRESKATPGPWNWESDDPTFLTLGTTNKTQESHVLSAWRCDSCVKNNLNCLWPKDNDADFIAHARSDIPALLAYVAELETELEAANKRNTFTECEVREGQAYCPACGEEVAGYYSDYCEYCGQALSLPPEE